MNRLKLFFAAAILAALVFGCQPSEDNFVAPTDAIPSEITSKLNQLGFNTIDFQVKKFEAGYLVENDIYLTERDMDRMGAGSRVPAVEQYSTDNLVATGGSRVITIYAEEEGSGGGGGGGGNGNGGGRGPNKTSSAAFSSALIAGLDEAIARFNAENLQITFQRVSTTNADITMTRLSKRDERRGVLGSAGFPTASGDPFNEIKMSGVLESQYGLSVDGIATIIAHEMGHCVGFRHTDYFDRSISCGGSTANEGDGGVGANHIPGTPTGASLADQSWMLACTDGSNRPFNNDDKTALDYLY